MLTIGDFSHLGQVSVRTLRLYDELSLLKPAQVDRFTGYRYYSIDQLPRLNRILTLKDLDFSLEQIAGLLNDSLSADQLRGMFTLKQRQIEKEVHEGQARLARVATRLKQIEQEGQLPGYDVMLKTVGPQAVISLRQVVPTPAEMGRRRCALYSALYDWLEQHQLEPAGLELALYHHSEFSEYNIDMEVAVPVSPLPRQAAAPPLPTGEAVTGRELPAVPEMASVIYQGPAEGVGSAIIALWRWIGLNDYATHGPYREIHLYGRELELTSGRVPVTLELQVPVEKLPASARRAVADHQRATP